jgi:hypothetical protein
MTEDIHNLNKKEQKILENYLEKNSEGKFILKQNILSNFILDFTAEENKLKKDNKQINKDKFLDDYINNNFSDL